MSNDPDADRRRRFRAHWAEIDRLRAEHEAGTDYRYPQYPELPTDLRDLTCGAKGKRTGKPCRSKAIYKNGRCKFHGGLSTGPTSQEGKVRSAINGRKGGRPKKNRSS